MAIPFLAQALQQAVQAAGVICLGVSVGSEGDRTTWRAELPVDASAADRQLAATTIATFDLAGLPTRILDARALADVDQLILKAVTQALWEAIPAPTLTKVQLRARILALYRASL